LVCRVRKYYTAAEKGLAELREAQHMIRELYREDIEGGEPDPE
jgi:PadR family transcriptional regulator